MSDVRNVIVIGGGPAGYTAALYAARANLEPLVIEGFNWGGQLMITRDVENYPGYADGVMGPTMMQDFRRQAERFGAEFLTDDVTKVDFSQRPFRVWVGDDEYTADSVIVATGASARQLGLESELRLQGRGVSYCATCDASFFRDKVVTVVGGGDSALEEATLHLALREQGVPRAPSRGVPRLADHGRPGEGEREDRVRAQQGRRRGARRSQGHRRATARHRHRRDVGARRPTASSSPSATTRTRRCSSTSSTTSPTAGTSSRRARRPRRTSRVSSPPATFRITSTGRRSPRPGRGAPPRSTPSGT